MSEADKNVGKDHMERKKDTHSKKNRKELKLQDDDSEKQAFSPIIVIFSIILIIVLVISGIIFLPKLFEVNTDKEKYLEGDNVAVYNYYKFNKGEDNLWYLDLSIKNKPYLIPFYYTPFQIEDIYIDNNTMIALSQFKDRNTPKVMYISIDPLASSKIAVAAFEIKRLLGTNYDILNFDVYYGIHYLHEANYTEYPVATCNDARPDRIIMMINVTGKNSITTEDNCIHINSRSINESVRVADAFAYRILGIVQDSTIRRG